MLDEFSLHLCDVQGRLFELAGKNGYDSPSFYRAFMTLDTARRLDSPYNRLQWAGEEYLLAEVEESGSLKKDGVVFDSETLYWSGYLYRYWHFLTGESSKEIYRQAPAQTMRRNYLAFHTFSPELAIEDLREIYRQKKVS